MNFQHNCDQCHWQRLRVVVTLCLCAMQMDAADFITVSKLDSAIESALNDIRVHNFAIDLDGNQYIEQPDGSTVVKPNSKQQELTDGT